MALKNKPIANLKNWRVNPYKNTFIGDVFGHPRFEDGTRIITSRVLRYDKEQGVVHTTNTTYLLGNKLDSEKEEIE